MNDPIGFAIKDFYEFGKAPEIIVNTNYTDKETIAPSYFFRTVEKMPLIEQTALQHCRGKVLDVGAGAGSHALYLQEKGYKVAALEKSQQAAEVMKKRGVNEIINADLFDLKEQKFDTILVLMNGTGIGGTLEGLKKMLLHLKSLLNKNGQILIDSTDIRYLFEEEDGSVWVDLNSTKYYGEMDYEVKYKNQTSHFNWLFTDFETLKTVSFDCELKCEQIETGTHYDYLAKLSLPQV